MDDEVDEVEEVEETEELEDVDVPARPNKLKIESSVATSALFGANVEPSLLSIAITVPSGAWLLLLDGLDELDVLEVEVEVWDFDFQLQLSFSLPSGLQRKGNKRQCKTPPPIRHGMNGGTKITPPAPMTKPPITVVEWPAVSVSVKVVEIVVDVVIDANPCNVA